MTAPPADRVAAAVQAAWRGDAADWPTTALILAQALEHAYADRDLYAAAAAERIQLWASVEQLRERLRTSETERRSQAAVIQRARDIYSGRTRIGVALIARRTAHFILNGRLT